MKYFNNNTINHCLEIYENKNISLSTLKNSTCFISKDGFLKTPNGRWTENGAFLELCSYNFFLLSL